MSAYVVFRLMRRDRHFHGPRKSRGTGGVAEAVWLRLREVVRALPRKAVSRIRTASSISTQPVGGRPKPRIPHVASYGRSLVCVALL